MAMTCSVQDTQVAEFADGGARQLEDHVAGCERCQDRLAQIWDAPTGNILEPTMRAIRLVSVGRDFLEVAGGVWAAFGRALATYTLGGKHE